VRALAANSQFTSCATHLYVYYTRTYLLFADHAHVPRYCTSTAHNFFNRLRNFLRDFFSFFSAAVGAISFCVRYNMLMGKRAGIVGWPATFTVGLKFSHRQTIFSKNRIFEHAVRTLALVLTKIFFYFICIYKGTKRKHSLL
jgi:hypothetical protein